MFSSRNSRGGDHVDFLLINGFSMISFASAIEPLRALNMVDDIDRYTWSTCSVDGQPVQASNGTRIYPDASVMDLVASDTLFVCSGVGGEKFRDAKVFEKLRRLASGGAALGGICTGTSVLARAGLLDGYRCTVHWQNVEALAEEFSELDITAKLYEIDRTRYTCSGGTAPIDMMLSSIASDHGEDSAVRAAEILLYPSVRRAGESQRQSIQHRLGVNHPKLLAAIAQMEANVENPAQMSDLARAVSLSPRQLERLFRVKLNRTPSRYYQEIRLSFARQLLRHTTMSVMQVAVASGFTSASHFSKCYREFYQTSPRLERARIERIPRNEVTNERELNNDIAAKSQLAHGESPIVKQSSDSQVMMNG